MPRAQVGGWHTEIVNYVTHTKSFFDSIVWIIRRFDGDLVSEGERSQFILLKKLELFQGLALMVHILGPWDVGRNMRSA